MSRSFWLCIVALIVLLAPFNLSAGLSCPAQDTRTTQAASVSTDRWQSPAKLHRGVAKVPGLLTIDRTGLEFRPNKGTSVRWAFVDIQDLYLLPRRITLTGYEKRGRFRPGTKRFRFDLAKDLPPAVAAQLAESVGQPVRNGVPAPDVPGFAEIPANHRSALGGTISNGVLRFQDEGIEYISKSGNDSRSWRWSDIRTLSDPDSYRLFLFGYRDTYTFNLKTPMRRLPFDQLSDQIFLHSADAAESGEVER